MVNCKGRIVTGSESDSLRAHVARLLQDRRAIVLNLMDVQFVDSSGLGTMVRALTNARQKGGDLKLCCVPETIRKVLELTSLNKLFDSHETEESAVTAFYRGRASTEEAAQSGANILCIDKNADVLAYLREFLKRGGYQVHTTSNIPDAVILMRATDFQLVLLGPGMQASFTARQAFQQACGKVKTIELGEEFSGAEAGQAAAKLMEQLTGSGKAG
jgi:anti-sigma B factor antagonist